MAFPEKIKLNCSNLLRFGRQNQKKMKKVKILALALAFIASGSIAGLAFKPAETTDSDIYLTVPQGGIEFSLKNDTDNNVNIYDGSGYAALNKGSQKNYSKDAGTKFHVGESGKKGKLLFEVSSSMEGKTLKLSSYM